MYQYALGFLFAMNTDLVAITTSNFAKKFNFFAAASSTTAVPYLDKVDFMKLQNGR
jgi:hypothetical protein